MKISDLDLSDERKEFLLHVCKSVNAQAVTVSDGNWESNCREITENNKSKLFS